MPGCYKTREAGFIMQAGHVIPKVKGMSVYYREDNVFCQCKDCNYAHSRDQNSYNSWFIHKFGLEKYDYLVGISNTQAIYNNNELEIMIIDFKNKLEALREAKQ